MPSITGCTVAVAGDLGGLRMPGGGVKMGFGGGVGDAVGRDGGWLALQPSRANSGRSNGSSRGTREGRGTPDIGRESGKTAAGRSSCFRAAGNCGRWREVEREVVAGGRDETEVG
jgi:hypothetical protein